MITRDDIREFANFHSPEGCAVTFYYQPTTPPNRSHRDEAILVKDLVNSALREAEKKRKQAQVGAARLAAHPGDDRRAAQQRPPGQGGLRLRGPGTLARIRCTRQAAPRAL